ncbi:MAG: SulP family inorganic anion transporter [Mycobacterium sp.]|nr:SulP family inorganic anion transporter [Mycobacterium sp.]
MSRSFLPTRGDVFGGLSAGIVALPLCLAFGVASGLGPEAGLYGAIATGILAAIFGGAPTLITGPTAPMTLVAVTVVGASRLPDGSINLGQVVLVFALAGGLQMLLGVLRLGGYIRYVPYPVISGFMTGIGVIIILQQLFPIAGMQPPASTPWHIISNLHLLPGGVVWPVALLALVTFAITYLLPKITTAVPSALVALVVVTAGSMILAIDAPRIGEIPRGLPQFVVPSLDPANLGIIISSAVQLAVLGAIDTLLSALMADSLTGTQHDSNRELIGQGIGNMAAAFIGGLPGAGASIRSVVNIKAGGRTPLSGVIHGVFLIAVLLGLSGLVRHIPEAVLAGILVAAGLGCIDYRGVSHLARIPRSDAVVMVLVFLLTLFLGLIAAVAVGLIVASLVFVKKVADLSERGTTVSPLADHPWADELDIPDDWREHLLVKHVEGPLFFGFARGFSDLASQVEGKVLVLRMDRVLLMDQSGAYAVHDALVELKGKGVRCLIVGLPVAQRDILEDVRVIPDVIPPEDVFDDFASLKSALPAIIAE